MLTFRNIATLGLSLLSSLSLAQVNKSTAIDSAYSEEVVNYSVSASKFATYYEWEVNGGTIQSGQGTSAISVRWNNVELGKVSVAALNESGCPGNSSEIYVYLKKDLPSSIPTGHVVLLPDVFTPNNDGQNDIFLPVYSEGLISYELKIFNRWGGVFFNSNRGDIGWDGTDGKEAVAEGLYVYQVKAKYSDTEVIEKTGTVTLFR